MRSRVFLNLVLLLIVLVLIFVLARHTENDPDDDVSLTNIDTDSINTISIVHNDRLIQIDRQDEGSHWHITKPIDIAANDFRIGTLLKILETRSHGSYPVEEVPLQSFGLLEPHTRISFNDTEIAFGIVNTVNNYRYIKVGEHMHLIDDIYFPLLSSQLGTLVSLNMLEPDNRITRLELPDQTLTLDETGNWTSSADISAHDIATTINNWKTMQAFAVHDYHERDPLGEVCLNVEGSDSSVQFVILDTDPWLIIARPDLGIEYHFNTDAYDALLIPGANPSSQEVGETDTTVVSPDEFMNVINR